MIRVSREASGAHPKGKSMANTKEKRGDLCRVSIDKVENGYSVSCDYEDANPKTVSKRAGWVPSQRTSESYVAKTKAEVIDRVKKEL